VAVAAGGGATEAEGVVLALEGAVVALGEEDDSNLGDFVADNNVLTPEDNVESVMLREHLEALPGHLQPETVQAAERRQIGRGEGTVGHVVVFLMGSVRTPIM